MYILVDNTGDRQKWDDRNDYTLMAGTDSARRDR